MIKSTDRNVVISGDGITILQDFVNITKGVRGVLLERCTKEEADEIISLCGRLAYAEDSDEEDMYLARLAEVMLGKKVDKS